MAQLATLALSLQLLLIYFLPPIAVGDRRLFLVDWLPLLTSALLYASLLESHRKKFFSKLLKTAAALSAVLGIVYIQGFFRPDYFKPFETTYYGTLPGIPRQFEPLREAVVGFRFWVWAFSGIASAQILAHVPLPRLKPLRATLGRVLAGAIALEVTLMAFAQLSTPFETLLAKLYGYYPIYQGWAGRAFGTFSSPLEVGLCLGISVLVVLNLSDEELGPKSRMGTALVGMVGILLAKNMTVTISALGVAVYLLVAHLKLNPVRASLRIKMAGVLALTGAILITAFWFHPGLHEFAMGKRGTFVGRIGPWLAFIQVLTNDWRTALFGLGFIPLNVDNGYLFLLTRGGALLFVLTLGYLSAILRKQWPALSPLQRAIPIYFAISAVALDSLIVRGAVLVFLAGALPILASLVRKVNQKHT